MWPPHRHAGGRPGIAKGSPGGPNRGCWIRGRRRLTSTFTGGTDDHELTPRYQPDLDHAEEQQQNERNHQGELHHGTTPIDQPS